MNGLSHFLAGRLWVQVLLACLLFLSVTVVADRFLRSAKLDLTEDRLYTLSEGTSTLLRDMDEPVTLTFYFSETLAAPFPQFLAYGKRVEDVLYALADENPDAITLNVVDPVAFSEEEDEAVALGLRGVPLGDGSTLYIGLSAKNTLDGEAIIPFFSEEREKFLEYDLVKLIATLDTEGRRTLGLLTTLPMQFGFGGPEAMLAGRAQPYVLYEQLQEFYDIAELDEAFTEIPENLDVLMLVQPPVLNEDQFYLLDQYVLKGGKLIAFIDPHSEAVDPRAVVPTPSGLGPLLAAWGVKVPDGQVIADGLTAQRVQVGGFGPDSVKDYPLWLALTEAHMASDDIVTGTISAINLASSGVIEPIEGAQTTLEPLLTSSDEAMLTDAENAAGVPDPDSINRNFAPTGEHYILSARIKGQANTAFPDRAAAQGGAKSGTINVALTADTDLFDDRFWVQSQDLFGQRVAVPIAGNGSFVLNLVDHTSGSDALLSLRGRGISKRPFTKVDDLRRAAERKYLAEEEALQNRLAETEARLAALEGQNADAGAVLLPEQEAEVEAFRAELLETRRALRDVKRHLREDIETLGGWLAFINIAVVPILVMLYALMRLIIRRRRSIHRFL